MYNIKKEYVMKKKNSVIKTNTNLVEGKGALMTEELTIMLLDISGSMSMPIAYDIDPETGDIILYKGGGYHSKSKLNALKDSMINYINDRKIEVDSGSKDKVGVIIFDDQAEIFWHPTKDNFDVLIKKFESLHDKGGTNICEAVRLAMDMFTNFGEGFFRIVLVSDGNDWQQEQTKEMVKKAYEEYGIITDTISIGSDADKEFMIDLADIGGGEHTEINTYVALLGTFKKLQAERKNLLGSGIKLLGMGE